MTDLISVIVPVYNAQDYLRQCLDSILQQTYSSIEVLCVDDASTDASWSILQEYADQDSRIRIFQKINEGVSFARNFALDHASGKYVLFVDADDWLNPAACEKAVAALMQYSVDLVLWPYIRETANGPKPKLIYEGDVFFDREAVQNKLHRRMIGPVGEELSTPENMDALCTVWGKLYRRDLIEQNQIRFRDIREIGSYEDGLFNLDYFSHTDRAIFINEYLYHYRRTNSSSITSTNGNSLEEKWNTLYCVLKDYISEHSCPSEYRQALSNRIALNVLFLGMSISTPKLSLSDSLKRIKVLLSEPVYASALSSLELDAFPLHWKVFFACAKGRFAVPICLALSIIQTIRQ